MKECKNSYLEDSLAGRCGLIITGHLWCRYLFAVLIINDTVLNCITATGRLIWEIGPRVIIPTTTKTNTLYICLFPHSYTLPLCETSSTRPETHSRGSLTIQCDPSSQDPAPQTGPGLPPLAHQSGPYQTAAWMQSGGTAATHQTPGMTLQWQRTIHHIRPN